ncbi:MAG: ABC transporter substrate-binding protein [Thermoleophilia bacterium]|nr:ABC transporter substrate-binding protein [Gaiellaceae bacterium]MDW8339096.1 ABC transporter substrate-binding protein [Thermoleophilia bacterium]
MDRHTRRQVEEYRRNEAGPLENALIDELVGGELDRQEFLQRATMFGLGASTIGLLLRYVGEAEPAFGAPLAPAQRGGTIRVGIPVFGASLEPYLLNEGGSLAFAGIPGEYLTFTNPKGQVVPWLATSWRPNADATVWTFQIRRGVRFHNGRTLTARDVVASMRQYVGAKGSNAGLTPYFDPEGVSARGDYTVVFRLKSPVGVFPYLLSQTTYQAIIQPAALAARPGSWVEAGMIGTGPFRLVRYVDKRSADLVRFPQYWGGSPPLDGVKITFFQSSAALVLALRAGQIDLAMQLSPQEAQPFKNNPRYTYYSLPTAAHRQVCMRTDVAPFRDARVRRAVALVINRPEQIQRVMLGAATVGNDHPFWKGFASTDPSIKQRVQNLQLARALLQAANAQNLRFNITTWNFLDHADHAASIQAYARQAGIDVGIEMMDVGKYYDAEPPGADYFTTTPWLNRPCTLTEYGARGVPNVYLTRCFMSTGDWNASHYKNPEFDSLARTYLAAAEISAQRAATKKMAGILLRDTPVIIDYFINYVTASSSKVKNYVPEGISHIRLAKVSLAR